MAQQYRMTGWQRLQWAFGMVMFTHVIIVAPLGIAGYNMPMNDQWLLALASLFFSLWWIPRERGLPLPPTEYERGYQDGMAARDEGPATP